MRSSWITVMIFFLSNPQLFKTNEHLYFHSFSSNPSKDPVFPLIFINRSLPTLSTGSPCLSSWIHLWTPANPLILKSKTWVTLVFVNGSPQVGRMWVTRSALTQRITTKKPYSWERGIALKRRTEVWSAGHSLALHTSTTRTRLRRGIWRNMQSCSEETSYVFLQDMRDWSQRFSH